MRSRKKGQKETLTGIEVGAHFQQHCEDVVARRLDEVPVARYQYLGLPKLDELKSALLHSVLRQVGSLEDLSLVLNDGVNYQV